MINPKLSFKDTNTNPVFRIYTGVHGSRVVHIIAPLRGFSIPDKMRHCVEYDDQLRQYFGLPASPKSTMY